MPPAEASGGRPLWIAYLFTRSAIALQLLFLPIKDTDLSLYLDYALKAREGQVPYRDFTVEYPPLAYLVIRAALSTAGTADSVSRAALEARYFFTFRAIMLGADLLSFFLLLRLVKTHPPSMQWLCIGGYLLCTMFLSTLIFDRLDALLTMWLLLWLFAWSRSISDSQTPVWTAIAFAALGLSVAYKLIPLIALPAVGVVEILSGASYRRSVGSAAVFAASALIPFGLGHLLAGPAVWDFLEYHARRGIQIESLYAAALMIVGVFDGPVKPEHSFGSWNVTGPGAEWLIRFSPFLVLGFAAVIVLSVCLRRGLLSNPGDRKRAAIACGALTIGGAVIFSKVFSPQYLVWAFPLLLLAGLQVLPYPRYRIYVLGWCVTATLTALIWPAMYARLITDFWWPAQFCVIARNLLFLLLLTWASMKLATTSGSGDCRP